MLLSHNIYHATLLSSVTDLTGASTSKICFHVLHTLLCKRLLLPHRLLKLAESYC